MWPVGVVSVRASFDSDEEDGPVKAMRPGVPSAIRFKSSSSFSLAARFFEDEEEPARWRRTSRRASASCRVVHEVRDARSGGIKKNETYCHHHSSFISLFFELGLFLIAPHALDIISARDKVFRIHCCC